MKKYYQETIEGNKVTLWDEAEGIGLQFTKGETLQAYQASQVVKDATIASTEEGLNHLQEITAELEKEARKRYPKEFAPIPHRVKFELSEDGKKTLTFCPHGVINYYGNECIDGVANRVSARPCIDCGYHQGIDPESNEVLCSFTDGDEKEQHFMN